MHLLVIGYICSSCAFQCCCSCCRCICCCYCGCCVWYIWNELLQKLGRGMSTRKTGLAPPTPSPSYDQLSTSHFWPFQCSASVVVHFYVCFVCFYIYVNHSINVCLAWHPHPPPPPTQYARLTFSQSCLEHRGLNYRDQTWFFMH